MMDSLNLFVITKLRYAFEHELESGYVFSGESHDFWEAVYVCSGSVDVTCDDNVYSMGAGDMIFYPPLSFHKINRVGKKGVRLLNISFDYMGDVPENLPLSVFALSSEEGESFAKTFELIRSAVSGKEAHPYVSQLAAVRLTSLIIELSFDHNVEDRHLASASASEYRNLVSYMKEHVFDNLSLTELAESNHVSVSYVKLLFNRFAGVSPKTFYDHLRLNTAKTLLKGHASVSEIAAKMNFSSPNYFSRWFSRATGIKPSLYRQ